MVARRVFIIKTLRAFLRAGRKCKGVNPPHFLFCGQYASLYEIIRVEDEAAVLQMTYLCTLLHTEMVISEGGIECCKDGALPWGEVIAPDIPHRLSIE